MSTSDDVMTSFDQLATCLEEDRSGGLLEILDSGRRLELTRQGLRTSFIQWSAIRSEERAAILGEVDALKFDCSRAMIFVIDGRRQDPEVLGVGRPDRLGHVSLLYLPLNPANLYAVLDTVASFQEAARLRQERSETVARESADVMNILSISRALGGVRDIPRLLSLILKKVREVTRADAGSIYMVVRNDSQHPDRGILRFETTQNDSLQQTFQSFEIPINDRSIVGSVVLHACSINIPDLYQLSDDPDQNPYGVIHDRSWDLRSGYQSRSMLTVPLYDISHAIIGVVQLINSKKPGVGHLHHAADFDHHVVPFTPELESYAGIVAQQAGIALENAKMQVEIQELFDSFVNASVTAIELRDPTTSGHSHRVAALTLGLADSMNRMEVGPYRNVRFDDDQIREIRYASLLHDFGKLAVRENVLVKAKKLFPDEFSLVRERFLLIRACIEQEYTQKMLQLCTHPVGVPPGYSEESIRAEKERRLIELDSYFDFICKANEPTVLEQGGFELLKDIANTTFVDPLGNRRQYISDSELRALSVSRGSLTAAEFRQIQSHVEHTYEFLRKIPWGRKLMNVPQIAAKHHEKLDGSGYPNSARSEEIPVQSRMMTVADIYDALTAADRPYKKAMSPERALDILNMEVRGGKVDPDVFHLFVEAKVYTLVARS